MWRLASLLACTGLCACLGESGLTDEGDSPISSTAVCQAGTECCKPEELVCAGNVDGTLVCSCHKSWACDSALSPKKCSQQPGGVPDGSGGWSCKVVGNTESCTSSGSTVPPGKNGWSCSKSGAGVVCTRPNNTPDGGGGWSCLFQGAVKLCEKSAPPATDAGVPKPPATDLGGPSSSWSCAKNALGDTICVLKGSGTPPGGGSWKCYWKNGTITCEGSSPTPPGGGGWTCTQNLLVGGWRCEKPVVPSDQPPGGGTWSCMSDSVNGTTCVQKAPPATGKECVPGQKMWCDGVIYCGYGQVVCGANGTWKTKPGTNELDCVELANGARPNTVCACYFYFFNPECCETPDCIVPPNSSGQICPASKGGVCDYCNPEKPECAGGSVCVVTAKYETFCAQGCGAGKSCPSGYSCVLIESGPAFYKSWQCLPADQSCYH